MADNKKQTTPQQEKPKVYDFGEQAQEWSNKQQKALPVYHIPKYKKSKETAIKLIQKYPELDESYFWILMNEGKNATKIAYTGLIISHDGMKIINDSLPVEKQVKASAFSQPKMSEYHANCMYMTYQDEDTYEFGEISLDNCKNAYPYAMLLKRTYDRVVRDKAKMYGIYSEAEADEFKQSYDEPKETKEVKEAKEALNKMTESVKATDEQVARIEQLYDVPNIIKILQFYNVENLHELSTELATQIINRKEQLLNEANKQSKTA